MTSALARAQKAIMAYQISHQGRRPPKLFVSWRECYRLFIELRRLQHIKARSWREIDLCERWLAREHYAAMKRAQIMLFGVEVVCRHE